MTKDIQPAPPEDAWHSLKRFTSARIALGSAGMSLPSKAHLEFQLAHALARDAVNIPLNFRQMELALANQGLQSISLKSRAESHREYLQRPDKGRLLNPDSVARIEHAVIEQPSPPDLALIVADGLSSKAIENHASLFFEQLIPRLNEKGYTISPICLVEHGRVAIGDPVSELFSARMAIVIIGERPGLSSPDSMGIYFTYQAKSGKTDAERNCISNIHRNGLNYQQAVEKLLFLACEADRLKFSGVHLKDETPTDPDLTRQEPMKNFLLE